MPKLYDMHCHLDFADGCEAIAEEASGRIVGIDSTVTPSEFVTASERLGAFPDIRVALGIHPWWVADGRIAEADVFQFETLASKSAYIGEIGLDFHGKRRSSRSFQMEVFARALAAISEVGDRRLIFLHAVKSYSDVFGLLEHYGTLVRNTCVFHWFQGSRDDFGRALAQGFFFSVGMRMLATPSGKTFAKEIPDGQLLVETDAPPHEGIAWSAGAWEQDAANTVRALAELRGVDERSMLALISENSEALLQEYDAIATTA